MSRESESEAPTARRSASFVRRTEPVSEFSNGKPALLAAIFVAAISAAITLIVLR